MRVFRRWWLLVWEPTRFFASFGATPATWWAGAVGPLACAAVYLGFGVTMTTRLEPLVLDAVRDAGVPQFLLASTMYGSAVGGAFAFPLLWLAAAGFLVSLDALFANRAHGLKQLELAGRAFVSQVPGLMLLLIAALSLDGETLRDIDLTTAEGPSRLRARLATMPVFASATLLTQMSQLWLCTLLAISYQSLARIRFSATAGLAVMLYVVFFLTAQLSWLNRGW